MNKLIKLCLIASISSLPLLSYANDVEVKLKGALNVMSGITNQKHNVTNYHKNFGFKTTANMRAEISNTLDNNIKYGGRLVLMTTANASGAPKSNGSYIFVESPDYGRIELGSAASVVATMQITAGDIAKASGDGWTAFIDLSKNHPKGSHNTTYDFYLDDGLKPDYSKESLRKISYYTPKIDDMLQLGISYIPDTTNSGGGSIKKNLKDMPTITVKLRKRVRNVVMAAKDAIGLGATLENNLGDGISLKTAITGEFGKATPKVIDKDGKEVNVKVKMKDLETYNIGAVLTVNKLAYSMSYGNLLNSFQVKNTKAKKTHYYSAAAAYTQGAMGVSLAYFHSDKQKSNKFDSITLGTEYKVAPGLLPYAEIAAFRAKGKKVNSNAEKTTKGIAALIGAKLQI